MSERRGRYGFDKRESGVNHRATQKPDENKEELGNVGNDASDDAGSSRNNGENDALRA